jgi:hypothetical protein
MAKRALLVCKTGKRNFLPSCVVSTTRTGLRVEKQFTLLGQAEFGRQFGGRSPQDLNAQEQTLWNERGEKMKGVALSDPGCDIANGRQITVFCEQVVTTSEEVLAANRCMRAEQGAETAKWVSDTMAEAWGSGFRAIATVDDIKAKVTKLEQEARDELAAGVASSSTSRRGAEMAQPAQIGLILPSGLQAKPMKTKKFKGEKGQQIPKFGGDQLLRGGEDADEERSEAGRSERSKCKKKVKNRARLGLGGLEHWTCKL